MGGRRKEAANEGTGSAALFVLPCRGIYSNSSDPILTSLPPPLCSLVGLFCRPFVNRQNRFRPRLNEWRPTKSKVLEIFSRSRRSFAPLWPGTGEEKEPRERVFYTCTFPFIFLSSRRATTAGRTDGQGRLFFSVLAMM